MAVGDSHARGRVVLLWSGLGLLLLIAFVAALGAVQRTYYSPTGFVEAFASSIAEHRLSDALAMPGAAPTSTALAAAGLPADASQELLRSDVLPAVRSVTVASDTASAAGVHVVVVRAVADGHPVSAAFRVRQTGSVLGLLPTWSFASTPLGIARITVAHANDFTVGHHTVNPRAASPAQPMSAFSVSADYLVAPLAPLELSHTSRYVQASPVTASAPPGRVAETVVDAQPTSDFTFSVQKEVNGFLDRCATQKVLQPAGCPFGVSIDDRVKGEPAWSIVTYPVVRLVAGQQGWASDSMAGVAHVDVTVQSLFDGTVRARSDDEPFSLVLSSVTVRPDGSLAIVVAQSP